MTKMKIKPLPTQEYLLECFEHLGVHLIWLERPMEHFQDSWTHTLCKNRDAGTIAGSIDKKTGYISIYINSIPYLAHRLIYKMHTGIDPNIIDHKNRVRTDNRFENLRNGTHSDNLSNKSIYKNNKSGYSGISEAPTGWVVRDKINGKRVYVGIYPTLEEAIEAKKRWDEA